MGYWGSEVQILSSRPVKEIIINDKRAKLETTIKFGTDGWRAVIAREFTFDNLRLVAQAIGQYLKDESLDEKGVFIGYDNRFLSEDFSLEAGKVLSSMGFNIFIAEEAVPTPVTAFMVRDLKLDGALMITASHNPSQYNGIKFIPYYGGPAPAGITENIEKNLKMITDGTIDKISIHSIDNKSLESRISTISDFKNYKKNLLSLLDVELIKNSGLKVIVDTMNGAAFHIMPDILQNDLGLDIVVLNGDRDPLFGGKLPDPSENNLSDLKVAMVENSSDIGLALDGDADRFGVIDRKGVFLNPNNIISLCLYYLLLTRKYEENDSVVRTVATTHLLDAICKKNNINLIEKPVGFKYIGKEMLNGKIIIGGEESGGLSIKGHIPEKDGLLANLLLLEIQAYLKNKYGNSYISDYLEKIYEEFGTFYNTRLDLDVPDKRKDDIIEYFSGLEKYKIENRVVSKLLNIDGAKVMFDDGSWILVRASGTEPLIRCYIESTDKDFFEILRNFVSESIDRLVGRDG